MRDTVSTRRSAIVPLLPYVVPGLEMKSIWSTALTFVTLFLLGASRALVTVGRWWRSGAETLRRVSVKARLRDSGSGFERQDDAAGGAARSRTGWVINWSSRDMNPKDADAAGIVAVIVESAVDGIVVIDAQGRIEAFNPAAERLFGYAESEVVGRNVSILMPSPYREEHDSYLERYLREGNPRIIGIGREVQGVRRDGTVFPLHLSVGEMMVEGRRKFTGILHDLSARVQLEEQLRVSEARWRTIVESAVDAIVVIDSHGRIEEFNPAAERLFGYGGREAIGGNVSMLMPEPYRHEHNSYLERYLREGQGQVIGIGREVIGRRRDGTTFPLHLSVGEMSVAGQRKFTGILHDLSTRVQIEQRLREQEALARLGEMAAVLAHEIRNPLAGIRGAMQVMASRMDASSRDADVTKEIIARVDTLTELMQDLLLFARPPQPKLRPIDLGPLLATTVDLLSQDPTVKGVSVKIEGSAPVVLADAELLKIVFQNLLINGAHAVGGAGELRVRLAESNGASFVAITDSGPGIPADVRERIFTPFFTTKVRGTGLGLPTAKRLIEAQGGTIAIDCPETGGTIVTVQLPTP